MADAPNTRGIAHMILGIVGANLALDLLRSYRDSLPVMESMGEGTDLYIFRPSKGGGKAVIRAKGNKAVISTIKGRPVQKARIQMELEALFPGGVSRG